MQGKAELYKPRSTIRIYHIFKSKAGNKLPNTDILKMELRTEISMIIKVNAKSKYLLDKLLPLCGGKEIDLILAEKLRKQSTNDEAIATVLSDN